MVLVVFSCLCGWLNWILCSACSAICSSGSNSLRHLKSASYFLTTTSALDIIFFFPMMFFTFWCRSLSNHPHHRVCFYAAISFLLHIPLIFMWIVAWRLSHYHSAAHWLRACHPSSSRLLIHPNCLFPACDQHFLTADELQLLFLQESDP